MYDRECKNEVDKIHCILQWMCVANAINDEWRLVNYCLIKKIEL